MEMTTLDELERLLKAGTPGPWERALNVVIAGSERVAFVWRDEDGQYSAANAALIVAAINALPGLLDRVEALEAALKTIDRFSLIIEAGVRNTEPQFQPEIVAGLLKARAALKGT